MLSILYIFYFIWDFILMDLFRTVFIPTCLENSCFLSFFYWLFDPIMIREHTLYDSNVEVSFTAQDMVYLGNVPWVLKKKGKKVYSVLLEQGFYTLKVDSIFWFCCPIFLYSCCFPLFSVVKEILNSPAIIVDFFFFFFFLLPPSDFTTPFLRLCR